MRMAELIYLFSQAYLRQLQSNPLRTKMLTAGVLSAAQELIASYLANDISKHGHYFSPRVPKMALYGMFVSAPLGHLLIGILQKVFAKRTSLRAKVLQILASNLIVSLAIPRGFFVKTLVNFAAGGTHPKCRLPCCNGHHCWRSHLPSSARNCPCRFHAGHEGQLDHFAHCAGHCPEVPAGADLGALLQRYWFRDRYLCQHPHEEEAAGGLAATVRAAPRRQRLGLSST